MNKNLLLVVVASVFLLTGVDVALAQNICVEAGPYAWPWQCVQSGSVASSGQLDITTINVSAGSTITKPILITSPVFSAGQMKRYISFDCPENQNYWQTVSLNYFAGPLTFDPPIPDTISTPGTYTYTARVAGLPYSLVSWWAAEGNPNGVPYGNNAVLQNGATYGTGKVGQGFSLDGVDDRINVSDSPRLNFGVNQNFTIECWIKALPNNNTYGVASIVEKRYAPYVWGDDRGIELCLVNGKLACRLATTAGGGTFISSSPNLQDSQFHHVALTVVRNSSSGGRLYVDGQAVLTFNPLPYSGSLLNSDPLRIGNHPTPGLNCFFKGIIDEVSLYACALSEADIQAIHGAGSAGKRPGGSPSGGSPLSPGCVCSSVSAVVGTVTITVGPASPVHAVDDKATVFVDTPKIINVLANDSHQNGQALTIASVTQGTHGSVTINADNTVTYTPTPNSSTLTIIAPPSGQQFSVSSVNIHGLACGSLAVNGSTHAALWQIGGAITDLDPSGTHSVAAAINDNGTVVGYRAAEGGTYHAFKYFNGQMTDLHGQVAGGTFPNSIAWSINKHGQICGQTYATATYLNQAFFLDTDDRVTHLDTFGGHFVAAYGINDSAVVVGVASTPDVFHAFKWRPGDAVPTDLNPYFSIPNHWAMGVNAQGDIAGYTALYSSYWAYVIQNGAFRDLSAGYAVSWANAINSKGQVVGGYYAGSDHALYWQGSQHYDLSTLLPAGSAWVLNDAVAINENGRIVGNGTYQGQARAFAVVAPTIYEGLDTFTYTASDGTSSASATVSVNIVDADLDTNQNGLPDWWEMLYFNDLGVNPNSDADGDGVDNYTEYLQGRNPNSAGTLPDPSGSFISLLVY